MVKGVHVSHRECAKRQEAARGTLSKWRLLNELQE
jgi:hypothetical protein